MNKDVRNVLVMCLFGKKLAKINKKLYNLENWLRNYCKMEENLTWSTDF